MYYAEQKNFAGTWVPCLYTYAPLGAESEGNGVAPRPRLGGAGATGELRRVHKVPRDLLDDRGRCTVPLGDLWDVMEPTITVAGLTQEKDNAL